MEKENEILLALEVIKSRLEIIMKDIDDLKKDHVSKEKLEEWIIAQIELTKPF